jgi:predicted nucleic acid-binding protein
MSNAVLKADGNIHIPAALRKSRGAKGPEVRRDREGQHDRARPRGGRADAARLGARPGHVRLPREVNKVVLDTCGWLAYFADKPHADKFEPYIDEDGRILVPAVVEYEVHRWALREVGGDKADQYAAAMSRHDAVPLTATLARRAAELGRVREIAAWDAPVYATAEEQSLVLVTADPDLQGLPGVEFHEKAGASGATKKAKRRAGRERGEGP